MEHESWNLNRSWWLVSTLTKRSGTPWPLPKMPLVSELQKLHKHFPKALKTAQVREHDGELLIRANQGHTMKARLEFLPRLAKQCVPEDWVTGWLGNLVVYDKFFLMCFSGGWGWSLAGSHHRSYNGTPLATLSAKKHATAHSGSQRITIVRLDQWWGEGLRSRNLFGALAIYQETRLV